MRVPTIPSLILRFTVLVGVLGLWCLLYVLVLSGFSEARSQHMIYGDLRTAIASETAPVGAVIKGGTPDGLMTIPSIGLHQVFVEGTTSGDLELGPGHLSTTPLPGQAGVSVIYGRAVAFGGPFRHITDLKPGDKITVTVQLGTFIYVVDDVRRADDPVLDPIGSDGSRLTLVTAEGLSWRSGWVPDQAVYVDADMQGTIVPTPSGRPTVVADDQAAMQGDSGALVPLVLWMQVLLLVAAGIAWAQTRWGNTQAWLVGAPAALATLWLASASAIQLLPNLM